MTGWKNKNTIHNPYALKGCSVSCTAHMGNRASSSYIILSEQSLQFIHTIHQILKNMEIVIFYMKI